MHEYLWLYISDGYTFLLAYYYIMTFVLIYDFWTLFYIIQIHQKKILLICFGFYFRGIFSYILQFSVFCLFVLVKLKHVSCLHFIIWSLCSNLYNYFELSFVQWNRYRFIFTFLHVAIQFYRHLLLKMLSFLSLLCQKSGVCMCMELCLNLQVYFIDWSVCFLATPFCFCCYSSVVQHEMWDCETFNNSFVIKAVLVVCLDAISFCVCLCAFPYEISASTTILPYWRI